MYRLMDFFVRSRYDARIDEHAGSYNLNYRFFINGTEFVCEYDRLIDKTHGNKIVFKEVSFETVKKILPYVGMPEKWIDYSLLGNPDKEEQCPDFEFLPTEEQYTTYTWYDEDGNFQAEAIVRYYLNDSKTQKLYGDVEEVNTSKQE